MSRKKKHFLYIILILFSVEGFFAQNSTLKITSRNKIEALVLDKIDYQKKHNDSTNVSLEISRISNYLKNIGYFTNTIDSTRIIKQNYTAYFSLNEKIKNSLLKIDNTYIHFIKEYKLKNNTTSIPIEKLQPFLLNISKRLEREGKSFSKIQLKNIEIKNKTLFADLKIDQSVKRTLSKVIIKGYENFPKSYLKNYFTINNNTIFNQKKIKEISEASKQIKFIKELKLPEILFTKDSTFLYLYIKKQQNNSFDGIISFTSKENGDILFNGNINLKLNNILNTGEKFELFWNRIGEQKQELKLTTEKPYIFDSKFSPQLSFSIYKQDSTFLNTKLDTKLYYNINSKVKLALTYNSESSENLKETITNNIETYDNYFLGIQLQYNIPKNDLFFNNKFNLTINPSFGKRNKNTESDNQFKIELSTSYIWDINLRNSLYLRNKIGYLYSDSVIDNELFRIGGINTIRGFNEQSIFTNNYNYFNLEYRFLSSKKSYLYSITDFGRIKNQTQTKNIIGLGAGYMHKIKNSLLNIGYVIGKENGSVFNFNNSKLIINWKSYF